MTTSTKKDEAESVGAARGSAKHTPGPWEYGEADPNGRRQVWSTPTATGVAHAWTDEDAALIAAAPDLYEALGRIAVHANHLPPCEGGQCVCGLWGAEYAVRTALAKAEGRSATEGGHHGK